MGVSVITVSEFLVLIWDIFNLFVKHINWAARPSKDPKPSNADYRHPIIPSSHRLRSSDGLKENGGGPGAEREWERGERLARRLSNQRTRPAPHLTPGILHPGLASIRYRHLLFCPMFGDCAAFNL